jgi:hypothetical protein
MANISQMTESKYLRGGDVPHDMVVTIQKVGKINIAKEGDEPEYKWAIRFEEIGKPMLLNATNIKRAAKACNSQETDEWIGKRVTLYFDPDVEFAGNVVGGLRIRGAAPAVKQTPGKPVDGKEMDDDIPW